MNPTPKLNKAIALVMAEVERQVAKDENTFAKYKYTSVDDYKDHLRPILAKHGLAVRSDQIDFATADVIGKDGKHTIVARFDMAFWLAHESGDEEAPERTTVMLPFIGAQTTGQARSYAQKEWMKSKFLATSGDKPQDIDAPEADALEQSAYKPAEDIPLGMIKGEGASRYASNPLFGHLKQEMEQQDNLPDLNLWWVKSAPSVKRMNSEHQQSMFVELMKYGFHKASTLEELKDFQTSHKTELKKLEDRSKKEIEGLRDFYSYAQVRINKGSRPVMMEDDNAVST